MKHRVYADLPQAGLGNLLLVWSRAKIFSSIHDIQLVTSSWWGIRPGTWLRNEKKKRLYWGYFRESPLIDRLAMFAWKRVFPVIGEPPLIKSQMPVSPVIFRFADIISGNELFQGIKPFRAFLQTEIHKLLTPRLARQLETIAAPDIALHIRRGDFKLGSTITPNSFFINCIDLIREETGKKWSVTVFTDAEKEEIADILQLDNVSLAGAKADILDILQMSRSRVIVLSQTSTFSYWAAFLSNAIVIKPWGDWYGDIRPEGVNRDHFEGCISFEKPESLTVLRKSLQELN